MPQLEARSAAWAAERGALPVFVQSNHEGALIDALQHHAGTLDGALVNLGAFTHTSYELLDAPLDFGKPVIEVQACVAAVDGKGAEGYREALDLLLRALAD